MPKSSGTRDSAEPEQQEQENTRAELGTSDSGPVRETQDMATETGGTSEATTEPTAPDLDTILLGLSESYNDEIGRIDKAIARIERQKVKISMEAGDLPELESFLRVKQREADDLMVQGKKEEAERKLAEGEQMKVMRGAIANSK